MNNDVIEKFLGAKEVKPSSCLKIDFKTRGTVYGFFITSKDYDYLKSKNFWRIVLETNVKQWEQTGNLDYAKIFNGSEITKLSLADKRALQ